MKQYTLTIREEDLASLRQHLFRDLSRERAAFGFAGIAELDGEIRILTRSFDHIKDTEVVATPVSMIIPREVYLPRLLSAQRLGPVCIFIHSHPTSHTSTDFSPADDAEEAALFSTAHNRLNAPVHLSMVLAADGSIQARAWLPDGKHQAVDRIRVLGERFTFIDKQTLTSSFPSDVADRLIRAFGSALPKILKTLHVGIVGLGGTGSAVCQQLSRLGVGNLTLVDPQTLDISNIGRVYASGSPDHGIAKVDIAAKAIRSLGFGTNIIPICGSVSDKNVAKKLRACDVIFGCTDDNYGRLILNKISIQYLIPLIDMAVQILPTQDNKDIRIVGRVSTLMAGTPCLLCRKRISAERATAESREFASPEEAAALRREGYLVGLEEPAPSVVTYTTAIASNAVGEFLNRLIGFSPVVNELYYEFHERLTSRQPIKFRSCFCERKALWGKGDERLFLGIQWG